MLPDIIFGSLVCKFMRVFEGVKFLLEKLKLLLDIVIGLGFYKRHTIQVTMYLIIRVCNTFGSHRPDSKLVGTALVIRLLRFVYSTKSFGNFTILFNAAISRSLRCRLVLSRRLNQLLVFFLLLLKGLYFIFQLVDFLKQHICDYFWFLLSFHLTAAQLLPLFSFNFHLAEV